MLFGHPCPCMPWMTILIWTNMIFMDGPCSCLWCFCWVSFLLKWSGCDLVMDDYHGRAKLNLNPHQLPLCPCVLVLDVDRWLDPNGVQVTSFRSSKNCHLVYSGWLALFQCPTLLPINRAILLLPSHISHIFFSDTSHPSCLV